MKKLSLLCAVAVLSAASVNAFEMPSVPKVSNPIVPVNAFTASSSFNKAEAKQQIKAIEDSVDMINVSLDQSVSALASVLASKEDLIKLKATRDELLKNAKPKEKDAIMKKYDQDKEALLQASIQKSDINSQIKGLSAQQRALVGECIFNLTVAAAGYTDIAAQTMAVAKTIQSNPTAAIAMAPELKTLGKLTASLPGQAKSVGSLSVNLTKIAMAGGITVPKATKGAKPKPIAASEF